MTGETKGSFWTSTAAIITAIGTLIGGLAAAAALVLPRLLDDDGGGGGPDPKVTDNSGNTVKFDGVLYWEPQSILLKTIGSVDLDLSNGPSREPETLTSDLYLWTDSTVSAVADMVKWTAGGIPTQAQCANRVLSHGVSDELAIEPGDIFCLRTNQNRVARVKILQQSPSGWEMEFTVWKQRLDLQ